MRIGPSQLFEIKIFFTARGNMEEQKKIETFICDRYHRCAGKNVSDRYKYPNMHDKLGTWNDSEWEKIIQPTLVDEEIRLAYN